MSLTPELRARNPHLARCEELVREMERAFPFHFLRWWKAYRQWKREMALHHVLRDGRGSELPG